MKLAKLKKKLIPTAISLLVTCLIGLLVYNPSPTMQHLMIRLNNLVYDARLNLTMEAASQHNSDITIIDIDEKSLNDFGRWPWPRATMAQMVNKLRELGAVVIAFDVVFSEPERNNATVVHTQLSKQAQPDKILINQIKSLEPLFDGDMKFATALKGEDVVLAFLFHHHHELSKGQLPSSPIKVVNNKKVDTLISAPGYTANLKKLQEASAAGGVVTTIVDRDGIVRRIPLVIRHKNTFYPTLALEAMRLYALEDQITIETEQMGDYTAVKSILLGKQRIPTDINGNALIPFKGPRFSFRYISASDLLTGKLKAHSLENNVVFIGTSAMGLADLKATPVGAAFPGVELHATLAQSITDNFFPHKPTWAKGAELTLILLCGIVLSLLLPWLSAIFLFLGMLVILAGLFGLDLWLWQTQQLDLQFGIPLLLTLLLGITNLLYGYFFETRKRLELRSTFGQYVPPEYADQIAEDPSASDLGGQTKVMSVLFSDIVSFTKVSEGLTAQGLKDLLNIYLTPMTQIVFECKGTIDKYVGDMIMAFWGAPLANPNHAAMACRSALLMRKRLDAMGPELVKLGYPAIKAGIGVNTGEMNVGDMGSNFRKAYTVLGDAVNLGSRLEASTRFYGVDILVSETTKQGLDEFVFRTADYVKVKGKNEPVKVFELVEFTDQASDELIDEIHRHEQAIENYFSKKWQASLTQFQQLQEQYPERAIYPLFINRIQAFQDSPPPNDWDGSFTRTEK